MTWSTLPTVATGDIAAATWGNAVKDNFAETAPAKATSAGDIFYATGANAIARLAKAAADGALLQQVAGIPAWLAKGAANQKLRMNNGATAPEWVFGLDVAMPAMQSGHYYGSQGRNTSGTPAVTANRLYAIPFYVPATVTFDRLGLSTSAVGNVRMGIYNDSAGVPGTLLLDGGAAACIAGNTTITISQALTGGAMYWLACVFDNTPTVVNIANNAFFADGNGGVYKAFAYAALPTPFGAPTFAATGDTMPNIVARMA